MLDSSSKNVTSAGNQQETKFAFWQRVGSSETTRETPQIITKPYLLGAIKDATSRKYTYRLSQKGESYPTLISKVIRSWGKKAWVYKEGASRNVYVVEFSKRVLDNTEIISNKDKADYIRGYFDAEGSVSRSKNVRYYIYFCQKNKKDLLKLKSYLRDLGISSGKVHNPSKKVDPNYWRFYIFKRSYNDFYMSIGSAHPVKAKYLRKMI